MRKTENITHTLTRTHRHTHTKKKGDKFPLLCLAPVGRGALWLLLHLPGLCWGFTNPERPNTYNKNTADYWISLSKTLASKNQ